MTPITFNDTNSENESLSESYYEATGAEEID